MYMPVSIERIEWKYLSDIYSDDISKLEDLLDWDCSSWKINLVH